MAYDLKLAERIQAQLASEPDMETKKMFGGVGYLLHGNMACGVHKDGLIVRLSAEAYAAAKTRPHTRPFDMTGRPMSGWLVIDPPGVASETQLREWIDQALDYARRLPRKA